MKLRKFNWLINRYLQGFTLVLRCRFILSYL